MKNKLLTVIALILSVLMLLCSCSQEPSTNGPCVHTDLNSDYLCDACQEKLQPTECTEHTDIDEDYACDVCGIFVDEKVNGWLIEGIPAYKGGILAKKVYLTGQGIDSAQLLENEGEMQVASKTTYNEFTAYIAKLEKAGYEKEFYRGVDNNTFASYIKSDVRVYAYFMSNTKEARIIKEDAKISSSLADFGYTYEKKQGEQSVIYQLALPMNDATHAKPDFKDNGMFYLIKLADNSVIVIDGANGGKQSDEERRNELMNMLWEITGKQKGETVQIAGWFITHSHVDHYNGFVRFTEQYSKYLDLERVFFALPSLNLTNKYIDSSSGPGGYRNIIKTVNSYYGVDDPMFLRLHTGQTIQLADVSIEVLQTHEDLVNASTGESTITDYNDASTIIRLTIDGETFLILGDAGNRAVTPVLLKNWSGKYLCSDGIQLAHHVMNDVRSLYEIVQAPVVFVPQSKYGINIKDERVAIYNAAKSYAREDMIFFQNEETVGIAVVNGQWEKVYSVPFTY